MDDRRIRRVALEQPGLFTGIAAEGREQRHQRQAVQVAAGAGGGFLDIICGNGESAAPHRQIDHVGLPGGGAHRFKAGAQIPAQEEARQQQNDEQDGQRQPPAGMLVNVALFARVAHVSGILTPPAPGGVSACPILATRDLETSFSRHFRTCQFFSRPERPFSVPRCCPATFRLLAPSGGPWRPISTRPSPRPR